MILKALSRRGSAGSAAGAKLIRYILRYSINLEKQNGKQNIKSITENQTPFIIRHNIRSNTIEGFIKEFKQNAANRTHTRSNQSLLNHFILSFSPEDSKHIDDKKLKEIK